ncbi:MAG: hypothetical protein V4655_11900 [Bdellovibrionota bacterium]
MLHQKKWFRILSWSLGGILAGFLLLLVALYLILKSPAVQQKIVASLKEPLAKEGVALDFKSLSIDLFGGVRLEGMTVKLNRPPQIVGDVGVESLLLRYKFWPLLSRRLEIREARLLGVTGDLTVTLPPPQPEPPPDPEALTRLIDLLRNPPATVDLPEFAWERVSLSIKILQGPMEVALKIDQMSLSTSLQLFKGTSNFRLDADVPATVSFKKDAITLSTHARLQPHVTWQSSIEGQDFSWNLAIKGTKIQLDPTAFKQDPGLTVDFDQLPLNLDIELSHKGFVPEKTVTILDIALPLDAEGTAGLNLQPVKFTDQKSGLVATLGLKTELVFEANLPRNLQKPEDANWELDNKLNLSGVELRQAGKKTVSVPNLALTLKGKGEKGQGTIDLTLDSKKIVLAALGAPLDLKNATTLQVDLPQRALQLLSKLELNHKPALTASGTASDKGDTLLVKLDANVETHPEWRSLHKGIGQLDLLAWPKVDLKTETTVLHSVPLDQIQDWSKLTITGSLLGNVVQTEGQSKALAKFRGLNFKLNAQTLEKKASGRLNLAVDKLEHKALLKSVDIAQDLNFKADFLDLLKINLEGKSRLDDKNLLDLKLDVTETPGKISYSDSLVARVDPSFQQYVAGLEILKDVGAIELQSDDQITLQYPESRVREVKSWDPARLRVYSKLLQKISQAPHAGKYQLKKPMTIDTTVKLENNMLAANTRVQAAAVEAKELAAVSNLGAQVTVGIKDVSQQKLVVIDASGGAQSVEPLMAAAEKVKDVIRNAKFGLKAQIFNKDRIVVEDVHATVDGTLLAFKGKGDVTLKTGRGGFTGQMKSTLPAGRTIAGLNGQGSFELPFTLTLYDKKVLAIESNPTFQNLSFRYLDDIQVQGLDGKISLNEELSIDEAGRIGFLYLNTQNPFTRVDFENIDPYLGQRLSLKISKVRFKHIEAGPILTNLELRQNLILLNEMKANLLQGSALGRVFIDLHPERLQLGFLGRFSNLQLELLKEASRRQGRLDELSGRAAANFDIRKRLATGRVDVTSIGRNQLLSMIDVLDPEYKDTQMMTARRALQLSYPSLVSISMEQGLMDLLIGLGGALSTDINVRSIPLTAFINANAGDSLLTLEKFLQTGGQ